MSQELKNRTKKFALDVIGLCAGLPHLPETRHAIDQLIRSSSSVAANYRSTCRGKSKADFIAKLGIVEEESDEAGSGSKCCATLAHGRKSDIRNSTFELRKN